MILLPSEIESEVRDITNRPQSTFPTSDEYYDWISKANKKVYHNLNSEVREWNIHTMEFSRSSGVNEYSLPQDYGGYAYRMEDFDDTPPRVVPFTSFREFDRITGNDIQQYVVKGRNIVVDPIPSVNDSVDTMRFYYTREPQVLHSGRTTSAGITANGSAWFTLASAPSAGALIRRDSAYVNEMVHIVDGTGQYQTRRIVQYTASNNLAYVEDSWTTTPAQTTSSGYELALDLPRMADEVVINYAAMRTLAKDEMPDNRFRADFNDSLNDLFETMSQQGFQGLGG